ncbi:hypothetical protein M441DRAFT_319469 [Trichoderma asperellum CBS 433.97]|uniref:Uncharacterized protein n=1 Tax=Trichoderma asperellum (strain ATCC 204424 / CBS 433.97 / NBRC 101777) TaxID=1042311 RepID=A0A2T3ZL52_TRIA4|nr:hypothetical protein M441DRAFT_319469 [Trichoderma asperellum CBS 433.97]PTB45526.1 hypothetical protein M441DRAFT_319469 [Trichoderma asperellum CBS 433.97]
MNKAFLTANDDSLERSRCGGHLWLNAALFFFFFAVEHIARVICVYVPPHHTW